MRSEPNVGVYRSLASAIASRTLAVEPAPDGATWTDGKTIYVDTELATVHVAHAVVAHAALLAGGGLQKDIMIRLGRHRPGVAQRYLALELARVASALAHVIPRRSGSLLPQPVVNSLSPQESLTLALGTRYVPPAPEWCGTLRPSRLRRIGDEDLAATPADQDLDRLACLPEQEDSPDDTADSVDGDSKIMKMLSVPGLSNPIGRALNKLLGTGRGAPDDSDAMGEMSVSRQRTPVGRHARRLRVALTTLGSLEPKASAGLRYPEWDVRGSRYRWDWCGVIDADPAVVADPDSCGTTGLERAAARVGVELERHRRQPDGDSLDMSALVDYAIERRRGHPDASVYENRRPTRRDLSVLVLLDCSGSTAEDSGGRTVFDEERSLAADLAVSLENLGDRVAMYGFHSHGKDMVYFLRIKEFGRRFDTAAQSRLGSLRPTGFTRSGAAMRHAASVLEAQAPANNMLMVVIGDGLPYDEGYEDRYARADVRQAIAEAAGRGIGVMGVGIRSTTPPEVLEEVWADASFRVIDHSRDIRRYLRPMMLTALQSVRSNGRRRDLTSAGDHQHLRALGANKRAQLNSYV